MKSTNLYSGLAIILAAAANTAVVGCAGVENGEDAIDAETSVQSVSSPCNEAQPAEASDQGSPCNGGGAEENSAEAPQGNSEPAGGELPPASFYNRSVTIQTIGNPPPGYGGYGADVGDDTGDAGYGEPVGYGVGGCGAGVGGYGVPVAVPVPYAAGIGGCGGFGLGLGGYGLGLGGYGLGWGGYGLGVGGFGRFGRFGGVGGFGRFGRFGGFGGGFRRGWR